MNIKLKISNHDNFMIILKKWKNIWCKNFEKINLILRNNEKVTIKLFKDLVEEGQRHGSINERDTPENYAYYLFSAFQGLRMTGILMNDKEKLQKIIDNNY